MKKFFTSVPLQVRGTLNAMQYEAVDNPALAMTEKTAFPILAAVNGYVRADEPFRIFAISGKTEGEAYNLDILREEVRATCARRGILCPNGVEVVEAAETQSVASQIEVFQRLIGCTEDNDELFACLTYGTKPQSMCLLTAIRYAYRLKRNTSISCLVYGNISRGRGEDGKMIVTGAQIYDETAMAQLDEITRVLAERGVTEPDKVIVGILSL